MERGGVRTFTPWLTLDPQNGRTLGLCTIREANQLIPILRIKFPPLSAKTVSPSVNLPIMSIVIAMRKPFPWLFRFYKQTDHVQSDAKVWVSVIRASASSDADITYETANIT
jgi:hypothetical protein